MAICNNCLKILFSPDCFFLLALMLLHYNVLSVLFVFSILHIEFSKKDSVKCFKIVFNWISSESTRLHCIFFHTGIDRGLRQGDLLASILFKNKHKTLKEKAVPVPDLVKDLALKR